MNTLAIVGFCYNDSPRIRDEVCRVLRYTDWLVRVNAPMWADLKLVGVEPMLFSYLPPPSAFQAIEGKIKHVSIPELDQRGFLTFYAKTMPHCLNSEITHLMHVGPDGFILNPRKWIPDFGKYDYIGAPWEDGVVGNDGFSLQTRAWLDMMAENCSIDGTVNPDWVYCHASKIIEDNNLKVAPKAVAEKFSTESVDAVKHPFGFHGYKYPKLINQAWENLEAWEVLMNFKQPASERYSECAPPPVAVQKSDPQQPDSEALLDSPEAAPDPVRPWIGEQERGS